MAGVRKDGGAPVKLSLERSEAVNLRSDGAEVDGFPGCRKTALAAAQSLASLEVKPSLHFDHARPKRVLCFTEVRVHDVCLGII